jgi:hypothetical protein
MRIAAARHLDCQSYLLLQSHRDCQSYLPCQEPPGIFNGPRLRKASGNFQKPPEIAKVRSPTMANPSPLPLLQLIYDRAL